MPKIVNHDEWRAQALTLAFELFARRGYAAVSVRELAAHLGVSTGKLYHYFSSKDAVFEQMMRHLGHQDMLRVADSMRGVEPEARAAELLGFVEKNREHFQRVVLLMLDYLRHHGPGAEVVTWVVGFYRDAVAAQLGVTDGKDAVTAFSLVLGTLLHQLVDPAHVELGIHAPMLARALARRDVSGVSASA